MNTQEVYVGIDVSGRRLDVHTWPKGEAWSVDYDEAGLSALTARLQALSVAVVVLEATEKVQAVATLAAAGLPVAVVNPRQVRDFARATGRLAKTDRLDAEVIARFAEAVKSPMRTAKGFRSFWPVGGSWWRCSPPSRTGCGAPRTRPCARGCRRTSAG